MQPFTATQTHVRTRDYMHVLAQGRISRRKEGGGVRVVRDFATDSLIGKQLITGQESRCKR